MYTLRIITPDDGDGKSSSNSYTDLGDLRDDVSIESGVQMVDLTGVRVHIVEERRVVAMETEVPTTNLIWVGVRTETTGRGGGGGGGGCNRKIFRFTDVPYPCVL